MKNIKFRAWDVSCNQMYWNIFIDTFHNWIENGVKYENLIFMQYTGLKDKNGQEIYEGDIVTGKDTCGYAEINQKVLICSTAGLLSCEPFKHATEMEAGFYSEDCIIIDNIYEKLETTE